MDKFGLIGDPIATSLSPRLFTAGYQGKYIYDLIEGSDFEASWKRFLDEYKAINVTAPFKEFAFAQAVTLAKNGYGTVSGPALKIGATNLVVKDNGIHAYNSDFTGIILSVADAMFPGLVDQCYQMFGDKAYIKVHQYVRQNIEEHYGQKPQALVVGTGGAGKAAAVAAAEMGFSTILMNRTEGKAQQFALSLPEYGFIVDPISDFKGAFKECDLVIYTLPMEIDAIKELEDEDYRGSGALSKILLEANYKTPAFSPRPDYCYVSGRSWVLNQAVTGYSLMTGGEVPDSAAMAEAIK